MNELIFQEKINTALHALGVFLSGIGVIFLIYFALSTGNNLNIISAIVYGISLVILYSASTLLHLKLSKEIYNKIYNIIDHCAIYFLIAGSYTPYTLITLKGNSVGTSILIAVWVMAVFGVIYQFLFIGKYKVFSTFTYLLMGWLIVLVIKDIFNNIPINGLILLGLGGLMYSIGSLFFVFDKKYRYNHAVWHVFVLFGSFFHYLSVLLYVIPVKN